jgi:beta-glucoside operon transcriptional antiterminator
MHRYDSDNRCVITRVLNNNVIKSVMKDKEIVVQDKGIAFGHHVGDMVTPSDDAKIFELSDGAFGGYTDDLIDQIPQDVWAFTELAFDYISQSLERELDVNVYFTLLDHIYIAVDRIRKGINLPAYISSESRIYYKREYEIASHVVDEMSRYFKLTFQESEKSFMTIHIIDASLDADNGTAYQIERVIDDVLEVVNAFFAEDIKRDTLDYERFINHLKYFSSKVVRESDKKDQSDSHFDIFTALSKEWLLQMDCVNLITQVMRDKYDFAVSEDDQLYLLIHLAKVTSP